MEDSIITLIRTTEDQKELINIIEQMLQSSFKNKAYSGSSDNFSKIYKALSVALVSIDTVSNKQISQEFLTSLLAKVKKLEILKITIAYEPSEKTITKLYKWIKTNYLRNVILDIFVEPKIIGGAIISSNKGYYHDSSLSKKFEDLFLSKRKEILSLLLPTIPVPSIGRRDNL